MSKGGNHEESPVSSCATAEDDKAVQPLRALDNDDEEATVMRRFTSKGEFFSSVAAYLPTKSSNFNTRFSAISVLHVPPPT